MAAIESRSTRIRSNLKSRALSFCVINCGHMCRWELYDFAGEKLIALLDTDCEPGHDWEASMRQAQHFEYELGGEEGAHGVRAVHCEDAHWLQIAAVQGY